MNDETGQRMEELLMTTEPMDLLDAAMRVSHFMLGEFDSWATILATTGGECLDKHGVHKLPACPILSGLVLALIQLVTEPANEPGIEKLCNNLFIPDHAKDGVRRKLNALFDGLGLTDDTHLYN